MNDETRLGRYIRCLKNNKLVAIVATIGFVIAAIFHFYDSLPISVKRFASRPFNEQSIFAECQFGLMPTLVPPDGKFYVLDLFPRPSDPRAAKFGPLPYFTAQAGSEYKWPKSVGGISLTGYRCQLTNYSDAVLVHIVIVLHLTFKEAITDPNNKSVMKDGAVTLSRDWGIEIPKIDAGANSPFVFYVYNMTSQFAEVSLPKFATGQSIDATKDETVHLIRPNEQLVTWSPRMYPR